MSFPIILLELPFYILFLSNLLKIYGKVLSADGIAHQSLHCEIFSILIAVVTCVFPYFFLSSFFVLTILTVSTPSMSLESAGASPIVVPVK